MNTKKTPATEEQQELESLRWTAEQSKKSRAEVERIMRIIQDARKVGEAPQLTSAEYGLIVNALNDMASSYGDHITECAQRIVEIEGVPELFRSAFERRD